MSTVNATKLREIQRQFRAAHTMFVRAVEQETTRITAEHEADMREAAMYRRGTADIALIENGAAILASRLAVRRAELEAVRDELLSNLRTALTAEADALRASQSSQRHELRKRQAPTVSGETASAMRAALAGAQSFGDVQRMHADALAAGDDAAAFWLETNSDGEIERVGRDTDLALWDGLRLANARRRGGDVLAEIESVDAAIDDAQATALQYRTTTEARHTAEKYGMGAQAEQLLAIVM